MSAKQKVMAARTALVLDQPFFGVLALRLAIVEDPGCGTAWVDGKSMGYDPQFIDTLTHAECVALVAHEVMHCALGHPWRRSGRDMQRWNEACDLALNPILVDAGFQLPQGALLEAEFHGKFAEWVYDRRGSSNSNGQQQQNKQGNAPGQGAAGSGGNDGKSGKGSAPDKLGEVRDAPTPKAAEEGDGEGDEGQEPTEADWQQAVQEAANAARQRGDLPGNLERFAKMAAKPRVDWKSVLRRFVQQSASADYTWTRPNRRYLGRGLYLPELHSEEMGPVVIAVDTSGSVDNVTLAQFGAEIQGVMDEVRPLRVHVMYCDTQVNHTDTFERGEPIVVTPHGGGGTCFEPVFEAVKELDDLPVMVIYLTDLFGSFPVEVPDYPVLWAATSDLITPPFGERMVMS